jgi:hypothetical protein
MHHALASQLDKHPRRRLRIREDTLHKAGRKNPRVQSLLEAFRRSDPKGLQTPESKTRTRKRARPSGQSPRVFATRLPMPESDIASQIHQAMMY